MSYQPISCLEFENVKHRTEGLDLPPAVKDGLTTYQGQLLAKLLSGGTGQGVEEGQTVPQKGLEQVPQDGRRGRKRRAVPADQPRIDKRTQKVRFQGRASRSLTWFLNTAAARVGATAKEVLSEVACLEFYLLGGRRSFGFPHFARQITPEEDASFVRNCFDYSL